MWGYGEWSEDFGGAFEDAGTAWRHFDSTVPQRASVHPKTLCSLIISQQSQSAYFFMSREYSVSTARHFM
jgi:hypothetical protein